MIAQSKIPHGAMREFFLIILFYEGLDKVLSDVL